MTDSTLELPTWRSPCSDGAGRLAGEVRLAADLTRAERASMYALLDTYFANVTERQFAADLAEKQWVILLRDRDSGTISGFSTLMRFDVSVDGSPVVGIYSGDTIVAREYWGESVLPRVWSRYTFSIAASIREARVYWLLICSGYKTYRFLPVFFREFFPTYERETPTATRRLIDVLARTKFGPAFDAERGVVRFRESSPLQPGVADVTDRRLRDPHVAFFAAANPGHTRGDELVCITELVPSNLTPAGKRMVGAEVLERGRVLESA